jgi:PAS domain-containing protein
MTQSGKLFECLLIEPPSFNQRFLVPIELRLALSTADTERTRIRQRWSEERFRTIFKAHGRGLPEGEDRHGWIVHIDGSLIRVNVSWESLVERHVDDVLTENRTEEGNDVERQGLTYRTIPHALLARFPSYHARCAQAPRLTRAGARYGAQCRVSGARSNIVARSAPDNARSSA